MTCGSELLLYLVVGSSLLVLGLVLLSLGPIGWAATAVIGLGVLATNSFGDSQDAPERTNCVASGSPHDPAADRCDHCGVPL